MSITDDLKNIFTRSDNGLMRIILINIAVFLVVNIVDEIFVLKGIISPKDSVVLPWLAIPSDALPAIKHGWSFITYMFLHKEIFHILFNMLWLYWLGKIFVEYAGSKRLVGVYLLGGLSGGILFLLMSIIFPFYFEKSELLGASAGVMAVVIASAVLLPDYIIHLLFIGPVRLKYLALGAFILTSLLDISQNTGGKIAHIGGALLGMVFTLLYKNGRDITLPVANFLDWLLSVFSGRSKIKVSYRKKTSDDDYNQNQRAKQAKIDLILDKISKSGYEALTKEEKDFLFKASGRN